jgi:hypothetical protein
MEAWVSKTKKIKSSCGTFYVTVMFDVEDLQPEGIIIKVGRGSSCLNTIMSVIGSTLGKILKEEGFVAVMSYLKRNECSEPIIDGGKVVATSCLNAIYVFLDEIRHQYLTEEILELAEEL